MSSEGKNTLGNHPIIVILGAISACIAIFAFCTGIQNIKQIFDGISFPHNSSFTPIPAVKPTAADIVTGNWVQVGLPEDTISDIKIVTDNLIYVSTYGFQHGVFKTDNGGKQWYAINNGLGSLDIFEITLVNNDENTIVAGADTGIWGTRNGGKSWQPLASGHPKGDDHIYGVAAISSTVYMVVEANWRGYLTKDFGKTWEDIRNDTFLWDYSVDQVTTTQSPLQTVYMSGYVAIFRSDDGGATWNVASHVGQNYTISDIVADPSSVSIVYVCSGNGNRRFSNEGITVSEGHGLYISKDGGGSWSPINNGLPNQGMKTECSSIAVDKSNSAKIFVGMNGQVYVSENRGESWKQLSTLPNTISSVTSIAVFGQKVCIGTNKNGLWCILY